MTFLFLLMGFGILVVSVYSSPGSPPRIVSLYGGIGLVWIGILFGVNVFNIRPSSDVKTEEVKSSVRENPSSYRPVLIYYSGFHRRYLGGGYRGGK